MAIFKKENGQLVDFSNPIPDTSIAPIENGATSTHNYVVGAYALVKGILKKVTSAISSGTAFSDSNSETTDVATELKELNDDVTTINTHLTEIEELNTDAIPSVSSAPKVDSAKCKNGVVTIIGTTDPGNGYTIATVPSTYRPSAIACGSVRYATQSDIGKVSGIYVDANGLLKLEATGLTYGVYYTISYVI